MSTPIYIEFDDGDYSAFRRSLIRKSAKGTDVQREFLETVRDSSVFLNYLKNAVRLNGDTDLEPLTDRMSEAEFKDPPSDTEQRLFSAWSNLTPRIACRTTFWSRVTCRQIENGRIESSFLAANGGTQASGSERLDAALRATDADAPKLLDSCVRTVLRRLGGLPDRGNRSVYVNCPLARAWWRERLISQASSGDSGIEDTVRPVVRVSQQYWENLVTFVVSRNSVFGSPSVRNVFIRTLGKELSTDPNSPLRNATELTRACRTLSAIQASRELSIMPPADVEAIMLELVEKSAKDAQRRKATNFQVT